MCKLECRGSFRIDPCLVANIIEINKARVWKTISSCCGHGKYPITIVAKNLETGKIFEILCMTELGKRKRNRYYKRDKDGYFFIPEVINGI